MDRSEYEVYMNKSYAERQIEWKMFSEQSKKDYVNFSRQDMVAMHKTKEEGK